jgi:RhtB (resistance to homoserine/threonine) family protein
MEFEILSYLNTIITVSLISIFMAISPGADFAMVIRNSIFHSREKGLYSSFGIALAIWIHVTYSIAGLAIIISQSIILFSIIKYLGAGYLIYIGWKTFTSSSDKNQQIIDDHKIISNFEAFKIGFITNALNPKTIIFFLSIFTQVVSIETPLYIQIIYGAIISLAHLIWFVTVAILLTQRIILQKFNSYKNTIEKVIGSLLMGFGLKVAISSNE